MSFSLEKVLRHQIVLLAGDEEALLRRALTELLRAVAPEDDDFDLQHMDADGSSPEAWWGSAATAPFLAERRTCVVRHVLRCDKPELLPEEKLPPYALLILVADEESGDPRKFGGIRTKWEKRVKAAGGHIEEFEVDTKALPALLRKEAEALGSSLTPPAASLLAEMVGGSLSRGLGELEKLVIYAGDTKPIGEKIVRDVTAPSREWNVFRLVEMVASGDVAGALKQLQILVVSPTKAEEAAYSQILPQIHRQLRLLWQARIVVESNVSVDHLPADIRAQMIEKPNFVKEPPYRQGRLLTLARQMTFDSLARGFQLVSDADAKLKGQLPAFSGMETLEELVLALASQVRPLVRS